MSPASYQTAPPRVGVLARAGNGTRTRDPNLGKVVLYQLSYSRVAENLTASGLIYYPPPRSGGEGDRTPDLVNAIHALSQLSYAPVILGPRCYGLRKTRSGGNTASYRDVVAVSSVFTPSRELFDLYPVSNGDPGR